MRRIFRFIQGGKRKRLRGLEEFEKPAFVGRMERVERKRRVGWWAMLALAVCIGGVIGWWIS